ncbi:MAG: hypothetical protein A2173_00930 [Planctomycetes bacterium RBG_13_44_8b]|nr:MAG: hypothetical protein A2173_00930 [Planctomycetes bacterium RBG_13_44_8b]
MCFNKIKVIDPLNDARWDSFVQSHPHGTIYQHSCWLRVLTLTYRQANPLCFIIEDEKGNIRAAIPCFVVKSRLTGTRIVSLPFTSYSDPLVEQEKDFTRLLDCIIEKADNISASYCELRGFRNLNSIRDDRLKPHYYYKIQILDIKDGFEEVRRAFPRDIVKARNRAIKYGLEIKQGCIEQDLKEFYTMHALMRRRLGFPIQPYNFFKNIWDILYPRGFLTLILAKLNKTTIAGIILFKFKDIVTYEFGSPLQQYMDKYPNHFLLWNAIEMSCAEGFHYFDFGKSPPNHKGLLDFKRRWGAQMYDVPYFYYPKVEGIMSLEQDNFKHRLLRAVGKNIPLPLAKIIGCFAYHHLG